MAEMGAPGEVAGGGGGPVNWGDNVAGMNQPGSATGEGQAGQPGAQGQAPQPPPASPEAEEPVGQPTAQTAPTAPSYWEPGQPLPWADSPDAPALPEVSDYPPLDVQQLLPAVVQAREQAIVGHFQALMNQATDDASRQQIDREYRLTLREYQTAVREQRGELREWQRTQRERQMMVNLVPALREQHAEALSKKHNVSKDLILKDYFTGAPIWNHQAMERQAQFLGQMGVRERVQQRGNRDAGIASTGASGPAPGDVSRMSSEQFRQYREQVKRSGGRLLYRMG